MVLGILPEVKLNLPDLKYLFHIGIGPATQYIFEVAAFAIAGASGNSKCAAKQTAAIGDLRGMWLRPAGDA